MNITSIKRKPSVEKPWLKLYPNGIPDISLIDCSLNCFLKRSNEGHMEDIALEYFGNTVTFAQFFNNINQTADACIKLGVKKGDIVTICSVMTPEIVYIFYALDLIGAIPNMVDPRTSSKGIHHYIEEVNSEIVCTLDVAYPKIKKAVKGTDVNKVIVVSPSDSLKGIAKILYKFSTPDKNEYESNIIRWCDFFAMGDKAKSFDDNENYNHDSPAIILHTGGTTGTPKCVMLSARSLNALAVQYGINGFERNQKFLDVMPPFIAYGFACGVHTPLSQGVRSILVPNVENDKLASLILKHKPNHMAGVPLHYQTIIKSPKLANADLSFLLTSGVGGDSMSVGVENEVNEFLKSHGCKYPVCKGYGMTEVSSTATTCMGNNNKVGSVGFPLCFTTVSIFKPNTNEELSYNQEGEICITGPNTMLGYYGKPAETANIMKIHSDGRVWIHTGDIGSMDEDGYLFLKSRIKRVIIRHDGFKVYSTSIEDVVSTHNDVEFCSVVAVKDREHLQGNLPFLFVVWKNDMTNSVENAEAELEELCKNELAEYTLPVGYKTVESLPYTGIGKIDYKKLEKQAEEIMSNRVCV